MFRIIKDFMIKVGPTGTGMGGSQSGESFEDRFSKLQYRGTLSIMIVQACSSLSLETNTYLILKKKLLVVVGRTSAEI